MKTLKDIAAAIDALPVEAFKNFWHGRDPVINALTRGKDRWDTSAAALQQLKRDTNKRLARRNRDIALKRERRANVMQWLKDGTIIKGTFIKVLGARDGTGIREVISWDKDRLHCRQWLPVRRRSIHEDLSNDAMRARGCLRLDNMWLEPQPQMTTHEYDKVAKLLS